MTLSFFVFSFSPLVSKLALPFIVRIGPLYIISGIGGSLLSALFIESTIQVGASGALFGLLGAMLSEFITNWTIYANKVFLGLWNPLNVGIAAGLLFPSLI